MTLDTYREDPSKFRFPGTPSQENWGGQNPPDFIPNEKAWLDGQKIPSDETLALLKEIQKTPEKNTDQLSQAIEVLLQHKWLQSSPEYIQKIETRKTLEQTGEKFFNILKIKDKNGNIREFFKYSRGQNPEIPPIDLAQTGVKIDFYAYTIKPPSIADIEEEGELASSKFYSKITFRNGIPHEEFFGLAKIDESDAINGFEADPYDETTEIPTDTISNAA